MPAISRSWVAFAAVGAGLIHLALVIGAPVALAIPLALLGLTEFAWGVLTFAREALLLPRIAIVVAVVPIVLWALLLAVAPSAAASLGFLPLAVSSLFGLFVAAMLGRHLRRATDAPPEPPGITRYLLGIVAGGLVIAALAAPALASTEAGGSSVPDDLFLPTHGH
ncbi:hypothetical protein BH10ACT7_BH10ACT7_16060 [soil metagenome]